MYSGEAIMIFVAAINPVNGLVIDDAVGVVEFYKPGKNPAKIPADREADYGPEILTFTPGVQNKDGTRGAYVGYVSTAGWDPGKYTYRAQLSGSFDTWEYGQFVLAP